MALGIDASETMLQLYVSHCSMLLQMLASGILCRTQQNLSNFIALRCKQELTVPRTRANKNGETWEVRHDNRYGVRVNAFEKCIKLFPITWISIDEISSWREFDIELLQKLNCWERQVWIMQICALEAKRQNMRAAEDSEFFSTSLSGESLANYFDGISFCIC